jgi:hypothetical protein
VRPEYPLDHATHIPILVGLGIAFPGLSRILEIGGGFYSTPLFLNTDAFPNLTALVTVETDPEWFYKLNPEWGGKPLGGLTPTLDPRWKMAHVDHALPQGWDLIFLDNSPKSERLESINKYRRNYYDLLVVHDTEIDEYLTALGWEGHRTTCQVYEPNTAVMAKRDYVAKRIEEVVKAIRWAVANNEAPAVDDVPGWASYFRGRL